MLDLIDQFKPQSIIEIGVWNGANAIRMIRQAQKHHDDITYTGYDLFEDATAETDAKEFNVKGHNHIRAVAAEIKAATGITPILIKGDTNETLKDSIADFVFLDGGHSVETIEHDYSMVKDSPVVVLDDFYIGFGNVPDTTKYGCNQLVATILGPIKVMDVADPVKGGGTTQLVLVCQQ